MKAEASGAVEEKKLQIPYNTVDRRMPRRRVNTPGLDRALRRCPVSEVYQQLALFGSDFKVCTMCGIAKPLWEYNKEAAKKDGYRPNCRACHWETIKRYRASAKGQQVEKAYREATKDKQRAAVRAWAGRNKEKTRLHDKEWYEQNREYSIEKTKQWARDNPEKARELWRRRRLRRKKSPGRHTVAEWKALCGQLGNKCLCCGVAGVPLTRDHIIPLSCGGSDFIENIQPLCKSCNSSKYTRIIDYRMGEGFAPG